MSRIRTVKPEFWQHPKITRVSRDARLFFIGLLNEADDAGKLRYSAKRLGGVLFPEDGDVTARKVDGWTDELEQAGLVKRYEADGPLLLILGFTEHQRINRPSESRLPDPSTNGHGGFTEASVKDHRGNGTGNREGNKEQGREAAEPPPVVKVFDSWVESTGRSKSRLDTKRRRVIENALSNYDLEDVIDAVRGWRHSAHHRGENDRHTVYNDIELLLRDAAHIERFRDLERTRSRPVAVQDKACPLGICAGDGLIVDESSPTGLVDCPCRSSVQDRPMRFADAG